MPRKLRRKKGRKYKSRWEGFVAQQISRIIRKTPEYEPEKIKYVVPAVTRTYCPDFKISDNVFIEAKGKFDPIDRQKHLLLREQYPNVKIYIVFQNANQKIRKGSNTTYGMWCDEHGIEWSHKTVKREWFKT